MAARTFKTASFTPVAVADTANFTNLGFMALQGGASTQLSYIKELLMSGYAAASAPSLMILAHDSTAGGTPTALTTGESDAALDPATAALAAAVVSFTQASTKPQRSSTLSLLNVGFNAFGGLLKYNPAPGSEPGMVGASASLGEISLSAFTGGTPGLMGAHLIYETK